MAEKQSDREPGAWIGQRLDENTKYVERTLDQLAERAAVTDNEPDDSGSRGDPENGGSSHG